MIGIIYKYTSPSNKCYIGQTLHENRRKAQHKRSAYNPTDSAYWLPFHKAIRKYGWDSFKYEVLYTVISENFNKIRNILNEKEIYYIGLYKSFERGYNCTIGGASKKIELSGSNVNRRLTEEHKNKLKKSVSKKIWQFDMEGNFIKEWDSAAEASRFYNKNCDSRIISCCRGRNKSCIGFQWQYKGNACGKYKPQKHVGGAKGKFGKDNPKSKVVLELDSNDNIINKWDSLMTLSRESGVNSGTLQKVIKKHKKYKGRIFIYEEDYM